MTECDRKGRTDGHNRENFTARLLDLDMSTSPEVTLFVKAGDDGKKYGACPFCQRLFMILLAKSGRVHFTVATVNLAKPPDVFKKHSLRRVPALLHDDTTSDNVDEIVEYLDGAFPEDELRCDDADADACCKDVFQKFCFYVKDVSKDASHLEAELRKIDAHLRERGNRYLCADRLTHLDCEMLPKLHQIRVAAKALKGYDIPRELAGLRAYLSTAYADPVFRQACPSDQEIVMHWADKPETPNLSMEERARLNREEPRFSFDDV